jgi:hypothetical protein
MPDAERMELKHLRHVTKGLGEQELGCSTLVVINCESDATIHLQREVQSILKLIQSFYYQSILPWLSQLCSILAITFQQDS